MLTVAKQKIDLTRVEAISVTPKLMQIIVLLIFFIFGVITILIQVPKIMSGQFQGFDWLFMAMGVVALIAVLNPQNRRSWVTLAASKEGLYICCSADGAWFLFLPWQVVKQIKKGVEGINWRGLHVLVDIKNLDEDAVNEIVKLSKVVNRKENEVIVDVSVGVNSYRKMLLRLDKLRAIK